ncbi:hypothetical protein BT69DRAFT_1276874 [Atractiella rhizophila]|nr:hypothetical protein BT69DRAFT_1276874 [Atractiella rhizophila]
MNQCVSWVNPAAGSRRRNPTRSFHSRSFRRVYKEFIPSLRNITAAATSTNRRKKDSQISPLPALLVPTQHPV